jgi:hypothetical protein
MMRLSLKPGAMDLTGLPNMLPPYTPSYVAEITGLKAEDIIQAARLYAWNYPSTLYSGRGIDHWGRIVPRPPCYCYPKSNYRKSGCARGLTPE